MDMQYMDQNSSIWFERKINPRSTDLKARTGKTEREDDKELTCDPVIVRGMMNRWAQL